MGGACSAYDGKGAYKVLVGKPDGRGNLEDLDVDGSIIFNGSVRTEMWGIDWIDLARERKRDVADSCKCDNEHSGSVKRGEFLD